MYVIRNNTPVTLAIFWGFTWTPFLDGAVLSVFVFPWVLIFGSPLSTHCFTSDVFTQGGLTRTAEIKGIPRSRTFRSKPCSAAWSATGPVKSVSPSPSGVIVRPSNHPDHRG